jgi:hypothetical protein
MLDSMPFFDTHAMLMFATLALAAAAGRRQLMSVISAIFLLVSMPGCATNQSCHETDARAEEMRSVYVVRRAQHTGIAIAAADWPNRNWSLLADFAGSDYLEFGWGEARYYQAETETWWMAVRAALWPNESVIHVIGAPSPTVENLHAEDLVEVRISSDGLRQMAEAIEREFTQMAPTATPVSLRAFPKPNHFYSARRRFFFPRMCNWWVASRLQEASCPIAPWSVVTAGRIMREARSFAADAPR